MSAGASTMLLGLAWFCALNAALSAVCGLAARRIAGRRGPPHERLRLLIVLRCAPAILSALVAACVFAPAHFFLEPSNADERVAGAAYVLAALACALGVRSVYRLGGVAAAAVRLRAVRGRAGGLHEGIPCVEWPTSGGITLAGLFRPRILMDGRTRQALTPGELELALAHEVAHARAHDNVLRALMWCSPDFLALAPAGRALDAAWTAAVECRADAVAANGNPARAAMLAAALIKVARLGHPQQTALVPLCSTFDHPSLLETRVRLLLDGAAVPSSTGAGLPLASAALGTAVASAWLAGVPARLHEWTELLLAVLP